MDKKENENIPIDIDKLVKNKETLPQKDEKADYAFSWKYTEDEKKEKEPTKKKPTSSVFFHTLIISTVFLIAFSAMCALFITAARELPEESVTESESEAAKNEPYLEKTVFIKEHSSKNGALTPEEIYEKCAPSTVSISAKNEKSEGIGSGFIYTPDGYIVTAHHVIYGMDKIDVILQNGDKYTAKLIASNELCDLALIKIEANELSAVELGESSKLLVGEEVVAIGTPASLDFSGTMTRGDVSYNDRVVSITDEESGTTIKKMTLIQTSAPLNPGNSGGPVFDVRGKLVGIVTMKLSSGFDGIGFAIPADRAMPIIEDMKNGIEPSRDKLSPVAKYSARLGIVGSDFSGEYNGNRLAGIKIHKFLDTECDAALKLREGDIIVSVEGEAVADTSALLAKISEYTVGDTVNVTVMRNAQLLTFSIILVK